MASGIVTVIILVAVAAAAFYLYKHYNKRQRDVQPILDLQQKKIDAANQFLAGK